MAMGGPMGGGNMMSPNGGRREARPDDWAAPPDCPEDFKLFVGNLPAAISKQELEEVFGQ